MQMATEHDLAQPRAWSMGVAGWCVAENGDLDRGLALATQAIATLQAIQSRHFMAYLLGLLADTHLKAGHHVEAMKAVEEGLRSPMHAANASTVPNSIGCMASCWRVHRTAKSARPKPRSAPPSRSPRSKEPGPWSTRQMKAYSAGPDTNGLIIAICLAFNSEEARFFRGAKCRLWPILLKK